MANGSSWFKTNSKLEIFLKRSLPSHLYDDIRYYEGCVVKLPRGGLTFKYVIVTGQSVFLTEYPYRDVQEALHLRDVLSILVEHDSPKFLKEPERGQCQHIRIYHKNERHREEKTLKDVQEEEVEEAGLNGNQYSSRERSTMLDSTKIWKTLPTHTVGDGVGNGWSKDSSPRSLEWFDNTGSQRRSIGALDRSEERSASSLRQLNDPMLRVGSVSTLSRSQDGCVSSMTRSNDTRPRESPRRTDERSISALLRRVEHDQPRVPRSQSSMGQHPLPLEAAALDLQRRSRSVIEKSRNHGTRDNETNTTFGVSLIPATELHLYVLHARTNLFAQLQTCWFAQLVFATLQLSEGNDTPVSIHDTQHLETMYHQFKRELTSPQNELDHMFHLLHELLTGLQRSSDLKKIFWKDQMMYHFLVQNLQTYMLERGSTQPSNIMGQEYDADMVISERQDELQTGVLLLDILLATLRDTDNIHDKLQMLQFNWGSLLRELIVIIIAPPIIPQQFRNTCFRMLEDFNEFSSLGWTNLPEAHLIKLSADVNNTATAILYELFLTIGKLVHNNSYISVVNMLENVSMECYIKRSITQLLGILFPSQSRKLKPREAVLVYQYFFVIKYLMENLPNVQNYIKEQYQEEFRYYIHWSRVNLKISESFPIKRLLQQIVEHVHKLGSPRRADQNLISKFS